MFSTPPVSPLRPTTADMMKEWKRHCSTKTPMDMLCLFDVYNGQTIDVDGFELLGYQEKPIFKASTFVALTHLNQRQLVGHLTVAILGLTEKYGEQIFSTNAAYCTIRSLQHQNGKYFLFQQTSTSFQVDANGRVVHYLGAYRKLEEYTGQPLKSFIHISPQHRSLQVELDQHFDRAKRDFLKKLGFTKTEEMVIEKLSYGIERDEICKMLRFGQSTFYDHISHIKRKAKELFPVNDFNNINDVVKYLEAQGLIYDSSDFT